MDGYSGSRRAGGARRPFLRRGGAVWCVWRLKSGEAERPPRGVSRNRCSAWGAMQKARGARAYIGPAAPAAAPAAPAWGRRAAPGGARGSRNARGAAPRRGRGRGPRGGRAAPARRPSDRGDVTDMGEGCVRGASRPVRRARVPSRQQAAERGARGGPAPSLQPGGLWQYGGGGVRAKCWARKSVLAARV
ncbi:MAG: hypothetical protein J3K34DRAFT_197804 [Monoraphidium minutum]|nr:MAG: hypothetical protein J3K34DRAFT_197804 [Monoraphidium minutum]